MQFDRLSKKLEGISDAFMLETYQTRGIRNRLNWRAVCAERVQARFGEGATVLLTSYEEGIACPTLCVARFFH